MIALTPGAKASTSRAKAKGAALPALPRARRGSGELVWLRTKNKRPEERGQVESCEAEISKRQRLAWPAFKAARRIAAGARHRLIAAVSEIDQGEASRNTNHPPRRGFVALPPFRRAMEDGAPDLSGSASTFRTSAG